MADQPRRSWNAAEVQVPDGDNCPVVHRLRAEPSHRTPDGGYRAHCQCGDPFEAATMGAAHDLVLAHVRSERS